MHSKPEASLLSQISEIITRAMKQHRDDPIVDPAVMADEIVDVIYQEAPDAIRTFVAYQVRQMIRPKLRHLYEEDSKHRQTARDISRPI